MNHHKNAAEWRPVIGYEGLYEVSSHGQVRSLSRRCISGQGRSRVVPLRVLTQSITRTGYRIVSLCRDARGKTSRVHRLVLEAFVCPRPDGEQCRHLDGDPGNNRLENLKWGTPKENRADSIRHGTIPRGQRHGNAKLSEKDVVTIRKRVFAGENPRLIAIDYGVSRGLVSHIKNYRGWAHI